MVAVGVPLSHRVTRPGGVTGSANSRSREAARIEGREAPKADLSDAARSDTRNVPRRGAAQRLRFDGGVSKLYQRSQIRRGLAVPVATQAPQPGRALRTAVRAVAFFPHVAPVNNVMRTDS
jgi:hypothetical protein